MAKTPSAKTKITKENDSGLHDSEFRVLLEQMKLKNNALQKIYEFFKKEKNTKSNMP